MRNVVQMTDVNIYQGSQKVLAEVNLTILKGEFVYLIGKTGSGKSSLLKTLYAALPLTNGKATVAGFDLKSLTRQTIPLLRRKLGVIFQEFNLLSDRSVEDNLRFVLGATGWKKEADIAKRIKETLEMVGLQEKHAKMPHLLSGGEQQRVVIARALLNKPLLVIADEPTGNLDPETTQEILLLLRQLHKQHDTAILFATHDYRAIEKFPARLIKCDNGRLIESTEGLKV